MVPTTALPLSRSTILSAALSVSDSPLEKVPISSLSSASLICAWRTIEASYQGPASRPSDLNPAATIACVACLGTLNLQGEARQVGLRVAFIVHREVLYAAPALSELNRVEEHLDFARVAPHVRSHQIEERLLQNTPLDVPLKQVFNDVPFAARRQHRHERRVTGVQLSVKRTVLTPIQLLAGLRDPGASDIVGRQRTRSRGTHHVKRAGNYRPACRASC